MVARLPARPGDRQHVRSVDLALLERARQLGAHEDGLVVAVTTRDDGSAQASVVNAGILLHPTSAQPIVGFVARGHARKLVHLRLRPRATIVFRAGWEWVTVEGDVDLVGPDDVIEGMPPDAVPGLLREIYAAAVGGIADDWAALDDIYLAERQTAVLVRPDRIYMNPVP